MFALRIWIYGRLVFEKRGRGTTRLSCVESRWELQGLGLETSKSRCRKRGFGVKKRLLGFEYSCLGWMLRSRLLPCIPRPVRQGIYHKILHPRPYHYLIECNITVVRENKLLRSFIYSYITLVFTFFVVVSRKFWFTKVNHSFCQRCSWII